MLWWALVLHAAHRIGTRALKNGWKWAIATASFVAIFAFDTPFPAIVAGAALVGWLGSRRWPQVFTPLAAAIRDFALPAAPLHDLLDAFVQDTGNPLHADRASLLAYCRRSANPVGRLLLHLYRIADAEALRQSDAVCSALQLVNFWQDLSRDLPRDRCYVPEADRVAHGISPEVLRGGVDTPATRALVRELCGWARELMHAGAPLAARIPGRAGWELRLVVQGGLRVLDRIERMDGATLARRPALGPADLPLLLWRALAMRRSTA